jgi:uncharacterized protein (UPF0248 family)
MEAPSEPDANLSRLSHDTALCSLDLSTSRTTQLNVPENPYVNMDTQQSTRPSIAVSSSQSAYAFPNTRRHVEASTGPAPSISTPISLNRFIVASLSISDCAGHATDESRWRALVEALLSNRAAADALVLQVSSEDTASVILNNTDIRTHYSYASYSQTTPVIDSLRHTALILSKWPFQWQVLGVQGKKNSCAVAKFPALQLRRSNGDSQSSLTIVACHFSHELSDETLRDKETNLKKIRDYLEAECSQDSWVLVGDFGIPTSLRTIDQAYYKRSLISRSGHQTLLRIGAQLNELGFIDAWMFTRLGMGESSALDTDQVPFDDLVEGEQACTLTYMSDDHSEENSHEAVRSQRCTRILIGKQSRLQPGGFNMFAPSIPSFTSAHKGVRCLLLPSDSSHSLYSLGEAVTLRPQLTPSSLMETAELKEYMMARGFIPALVDKNIRKDSQRLLERILLSKTSETDGPTSSHAVTLILALVGSSGLGVESKSSTVDYLCIGNISPKIFFSLATQRLKKEHGAQIHDFKRGRGAAGTKIELEIQGVRFDVHYCSAASIADKWPDIMKRPSSDQEFDLAFETLAQLKPVRDLYYLRKSIPDIAQYRVCHMAIRSWAQSRGIFDNLLGLLGDAHITALLVPVCKLLALHGSTVSTTDLLNTFFSHYADFDWKTKPVFDPFFHRNLTYRRSFREALCLLGWHSPALNNAAMLTAAAAGTIFAEFQRAREVLKQEDLTWDRFFGLLGGTKSPSTSASQEFLRSYRLYARVEMRYWGIASTKLGKTLKKLRSELVKTLQDIDKKAPAVKARIWPHPFAETSRAKDDSNGSEYHANYFIGLDTQDAAFSASDEATLDSILRDHGRSMGKHYDSRSWWIQWSLTKSEELQPQQFQQVQVELAGDTDEMDSEDCDSVTDEEDDEWADEAFLQAEGTNTIQEGVHRTSLADHTSKQPAAGPPMHGEDAKVDRKLRSAADVMSRLRWDPGMDVSDYVVGYVDRFRGPQEKLLEQWKSEQTEEDFIPQHRILYFKRIGDGAVVWDRRLRIDDVFGSGIDAVAPGHR